MKIITIHRHDDNHIKEKPKLLNTAIDYMSKYGNHFNTDTLKYALEHMENNDKTEHRFTVEDIKQYIDNNGHTYPSKSNLFDITYTANMAYADFYNVVLYTTDDCIRYALAVAEDIDGYEGIEFCRWLADLMGKNVNVEWNNFT